MNKIGRGCFDKPECTSPNRRPCKKNGQSKRRRQGMDFSSCIHPRKKEGESPPFFMG